MDVLCRECSRVMSDLDLKTDELRRAIDAEVTEQVGIAIKACAEVAFKEWAGSKRTASTGRETAYRIATAILRKFEVSWK